MEISGFTDSGKTDIADGIRGRRIRLNVRHPGKPYGSDRPGRKNRQRPIKNTIDRMEGNGNFAAAGDGKRRER